MAVLDAPLRNAAKTILETFGKSVTVTLQDASGSYNVGQGQQGQTPTVISTHALETTVRGGHSPQKTAGPHEDLRVNTKWVVPAIDFPVRGPLKNDAVAFGTQEYRVLDVVVHHTGDLAGLYEMRIGR